MFLGPLQLFRPALGASCAAGNEKAALVSYREPSQECPYRTDSTGEIAGVRLSEHGQRSWSQGTPPSL